MVSKEARLAAIDFKNFEVLPDLYLFLSPDLFIINASNAYLDATHTNRERIIGKYVFEAFPDNPEHLEATGAKNLHNSLKQVLQFKQPHEMEVQRYDVPLPDGRFEKKYWKPLNTPVLDDEGNIIYIIHKVVDVTTLTAYKKEIAELNIRTLELTQEVVDSQKKLDEQFNALKLLQNLDKDYQMRFRLLLDNLPQITWTSLPSGEISFFNKRWFEYTGLNFKESQNNSFEKVLHPEDLQYMLNKYSDALRTGYAYRLEARLKQGKEQQYRWFLIQCQPLITNENNILFWIGSATDIQDQKMAIDQIRIKNNELNKINADLDNFIYTASHDLKAPISNLEGLINAFHDIQITEEQEQFIQLMYLSVNRLKSTINELTDITYIQKIAGEKPEAINFQELTSEIIESIKAMIENHKAEIITNFGVSEVHFSKKNLRSIIYNLLSNAIKYRSPERNPVIKIRSHKEQQYTVLSIEDNGLGMNLQNKEKIFGMFKRLHDHVEGTGIGLYIVKRMVENADGKIDVESEINKGTTFKVYLKS